MSLTVTNNRSVRALLEVPNSFWMPFVRRANQRLINSILRLFFGD